MFQLRDKTRRRLSLAALLALGVAPTVIVLALGVARHMPGHARSVADRLSWRLDQKVSIAAVRYLRPGVVLYEGFELADPETGDRILRCRALTVGRQMLRDSAGRRRPCLVLVASEPVVEGDRLDRLWQLVRGALAGRIGPAGSDVRLAAGAVRLHQGDAYRTLTQLEGRIDRLPGGSQADASFRLADVDTPEPIQLRAARNAQAEPPASGMGVYTGGGALPCPLLALGLPEFRALGPESWFSGYVWANETPEGWGGELAGQFTGVDLDRLVARQLPYSLRSAAEISVQKALFRQGRLEEATGLLVAEPGTISRTLVDAAADRLRMVRGLEPRHAGQLISYDRLALSFRIDSHGVELRGACPPAGSGAVLTASSGVLLGEPRTQPVPVAALIQTFAPDGPVEVPATRQTDWLMRRLPLPDAFPLRTAAVPSRAPR